MLILDPAGIDLLTAICVYLIFHFGSYQKLFWRKNAITPLNLYEVTSFSVTNCIETTVA